MNWCWLPMRAAIALVTLAMTLPASAGERCLAIDGDTLVCNRQKVRLTNVYAAELDEPGGRAAKERLRGMISSGEVTLRPLGTDRYGRILAEVYVDGRRIEQSDIGPRSGRGAQWSGERHLGAPPSHRRSAHRRRNRRLSNLVRVADAVLA
jgi:micrococcal nuclease